MTFSFVFGEISHSILVAQGWGSPHGIVQVSFSSVPCFWRVFSILQYSDKSWDKYTMSEIILNLSNCYNTLVHMWHNIYITVIKYHKSYSGAGGPTFLYNLKCPNVAITRIEVFYIFFHIYSLNFLPLFSKIVTIYHLILFIMIILLIVLLYNGLK